MPLSRSALLAELATTAASIRYLPLFHRVRGATMIGPFDYGANLALAKRAVGKPHLANGAIVECGTWRGGMAAGLVKVGGTSRRYLFCDSFEGLPPPQAIDGPDARRWAGNPQGERYFNNCRASRDEFVQTMRYLGIADDLYEIVVGFYTDTLPQIAVSKVAVLRLDCDWYGSTIQCLEKFWPSILPGGLILLDDYYDWEGCRKAVHGYLAATDRPEAIRRLPGTGFAYIWKAIDGDLDVDE